MFQLEDQKIVVFTKSIFISAIDFISVYIPTVTHKISETDSGFHVE